MKPFENFDWKSFWDNSGGYTDDYTGKAPTDRDILDIEKASRVLYRTYQAPKRWYSCK